MVAAGPGNRHLQGTFERTAAEAGILSDTGSDLAIAVRLRVGSFHKKAALEQGSVIRMATVEGTTLFTAKHSIFSDNDVIGEPHFEVFNAHVEPVLADDFIRSWRPCCPNFWNWPFASPLQAQTHCRK